MSYDAEGAEKDRNVLLISPSLVNLLLPRGILLILRRKALLCNSLLVLNSSVLQGPS